MKMRLITTILLATLLFESCSTSNNTKVSQKTITEAPQKITEVRPGIYMSKELSDLPFPTAGYRVYIVGEQHGNQQTKLVFQSYLQRLYKEAGLRDVALEEDQAYESDANAYVRGQTGELASGLCLRTDILGQIREFNASLPANEKVSVHLVDVDSPFPLIYKHLTELHAQMGSKAESIQIPPLSELETWAPGPIYDLIEELQKISSDQPDITNGLDTVHLSFRWYFLGNDMDSGKGARKTFFPLREDIITKNIQHVVTQLHGKPLLVFIGADHGMRVMVEPNPPAKDFTTLAQRLIAAKVQVYSAAVMGASGNGYWRDGSFEYGKGIDEIRFKGGDPLVSFFEKNPEERIIYADLRTTENSTMQLSSVIPDIPAGQIYDGLVIYKEFTPMENACPP